MTAHQPVREAFVKLVLDNGQTSSEKIDAALHLLLSLTGQEKGLVSTITATETTVAVMAPSGAFEAEEVAALTQLARDKCRDGEGITRWHSSVDGNSSAPSGTRQSIAAAYLIATVADDTGPAHRCFVLCGRRASELPADPACDELLLDIVRWIAAEMGRQEALQALEDSERFLGLVLDAMPDFIFVKDEDSRIVRANPAFMNLFSNEDRDKVLGTTATHALDPAGVALFFAQDKIAFEKGESQAEQTVRFPDGELRTLDTKKQRFEDAAQKPYLLAVARDVTDRREAAAAQQRLVNRLADSNRFNEAIMDGAQHLIIATDRNGVIRSMNRSAQETLGYEEREAIGVFSLDRWYASEELVQRANELSEELGAVIEPGFAVFAAIPMSDELETREWTLICKNGQRFPASVTVSCMRDSTGSVTGFLAIIEDISERRLQQRRLAESEERYQLAVDGASVGIWDWNIETGKLFWSAKSNDILGLDADEHEASIESYLEMIHPDDREDVDSALKEHLLHGVPYDVEYRIAKEDSSYIWERARGQATWNKRGEATRMAGSVEDISVKHAAQEAMVRSNLELKRFAYVASHDLQEPLRMVSSFTQLLEKHYSAALDERGISFLHQARDGADRMIELVRELLEYARIENEAESLVPVQLNELRDEVSANLRESIVKTGASISWPEMPEVIGDPVRLLSVFQNLIGNAIKYRRADTAPEVKVDVVPLPDFWQFSVSDNGIGIKQEYCQQIFEPFKRLHRPNEYAGAGMGLSICQKSIERLGGKIWAISRPDYGSAFYFTLPRQVDEKARGAND